jgi:hypothetical protein
VSRIERNGSRSLRRPKLSAVKESSAPGRIIIIIISSVTMLRTAYRLTTSCSTAQLHSFLSSAL